MYYTVVLKHRSHTIDLFSQGEQFYFNPAAGDVVITDATLECVDHELVIEGLQRTYDYFPVEQKFTEEDFKNSPFRKSRFSEVQKTRWELTSKFPFIEKKVDTYHVIPRGWSSHEKSQLVVITVNKADFCIHDFSAEAINKLCKEKTS
jgi:hypothetical protein